MPPRFRLRSLAVLAVLLALTAGAPAAEPTYPPGSRIGLVPPEGMRVSRAFSGFEDVENRTAIILAELPLEAFPALEKGIFTDALRQQGVEADKRELFAFETGMGFLVTGRQEINGAPHRKWFVVANDAGFTMLVTVQRPESSSEAYPDEAVRKALKSVAVRTVPAEEQLEAMPFKVGDLAGFPHVKTLVRGAALLLSDGTAGIAEKAEQPYMVVSVAPGAPPAAADRGNFAQRLLAGIQGYRDVRITSSEPQRVGGMPGYEIRAEAKHDPTGAEVVLVQWLRFGPGGYMRIVGIAQKPDWPEAFNRFRTVRDGIEPK